MTTRLLLASALFLALGASAYAQEEVPKGATGGPAGAPNQAQSVVPKGATGGRSGGAHQSKFVKKPHANKKHH